MQNVGPCVKQQRCCTVGGRRGCGGENLEGLFKETGAEKVKDKVETLLTVARRMARLKPAAEDIEQVKVACLGEHSSSVLGAAELAEYQGLEIARVEIV